MGLELLVACGRQERGEFWGLGRGSLGNPKGEVEKKVNVRSRE